LLNIMGVDDNTYFMYPEDPPIIKEFVYPEDLPIIKEIASLQKTLPLRIDEYTKLTNVSINDKRIVYQYTMAVDFQFDAGARRMLITDGCANINIMSLIDKGYILTHRYYINNTLILDFYIDKIICAELVQ